MYFFRMALPGLYGYSFFRQTTRLTWTFHCHSAALAWLIICLLTGSRLPCLFCPLCSNADTYPCISFYESSLYIAHSGIYNKLTGGESLIKVYLSLLLPSREYFLSIKHCIAILCHVMDRSQNFSKFCACVFMSFQLMEIYRKIYRTRWACFLCFSLNSFFLDPVPCHSGKQCREFSDIENMGR